MKIQFENLFVFLSTQTTPFVRVWVDKLEPMNVIFLQGVYSKSRESLINTPVKNQERKSETGCFQTTNLSTHSKSHVLHGLSDLECSSVVWGVQGSWELILSSSISPHASSSTQSSSTDEPVAGGGAGKELGAIDPTRVAAIRRLKDTSLWASHHSIHDSARPNGARKTAEIRTISGMAACTASAVGPRARPTKTCQRSHNHQVRWVESLGQRLVSAELVGILASSEEVETDASLLLVGEQGTGSRLLFDQK